MSLHDMRQAVHDHVLRSTIAPDAESQREKQAKAVEAHLARLAEEEARLPAIAKESEPISQNPLIAASRFKPRFKDPKQSNKRRTK